MTGLFPVRCVLLALSGGVGVMPHNDRSKDLHAGRIFFRYNPLREDRTPEPFRANRIYESMAG